MTDNLMDIRALAEYLQMNKMTIYKLAREGTIPAFKVASEWRFRKDLIDAWLMRQVKPKTLSSRPITPAQGNLSAGATVLVVDDESTIRELFVKLLSDYRVLTAESGEQALQVITKDRPDLVLLDFRMPGIDGIETLQRIKEADSTIAVVMLSAFMTLELDIKAVRMGAYSSLAKPCDPENIRQVVEEAMASSSHPVGNSSAAVGKSA